MSTKGLVSAFCTQESGAGILQGFSIFGILVLRLCLLGSRLGILRVRLDILLEILLSSGNAWG